MHMFSYIVSIIAIIGSILNIQGKKSCFVLWIFTNTFFSIHNFIINEYSQGLLFIVCGIISICGIVKWNKINKIGEDSKFNASCNVKK